MKGGTYMYTYTFNGVVYTADNLIKLQELLEEAGYTGNVAKFFSEIVNEDIDSAYVAAMNDLNNEELFNNNSLEQDLKADYEHDDLDQLN
jgi:hypothetical protein